MIIMILFRHFAEFDVRLNTEADPCMYLHSIHTFLSLLHMITGDLDNPTEYYRRFPLQKDMKMLLLGRYLASLCFG
jgi:hypothetical protein